MENNVLIRLKWSGQVFEFARSANISQVDVKTVARMQPQKTDFGQKETSY